MALIICEECGKEYSDRAVSCPNCGCPNRLQTSQQLIRNDGSTEMNLDKALYDDVIKHLRYAKDIETTIYTLNTAHGYIEQKIRRLGHHRKIDPPASIDYNFYFWTILLSTFFISLFLSCLLLNENPEDFILILFILPVFFGFEHLAINLGIAAAAAVIITAVSGILYVIRKKVVHAGYMREYRRELYADGQRVQQENIQIGILRQQQYALKQEVSKNEGLLKRLYSLDIIFPKYRNMVAVITMLEYLESGRCSRLTGSHGAYDTYSYEEKQNIIIGKLDTVVRMLHEIRKTQYMLYEAIQEANVTANEIYTQSERIIAANDQIAQNSALIAYNTSVIRRNSEISAYVDMYI